METSWKLAGKPSGNVLETCWKTIGSV
jgi:hypothetical protein